MDLVIDLYFISHGVTLEALDTQDFEQSHMEMGISTQHGYAHPLLILHGGYIHSVWECPSAVSQVHGHDHLPVVMSTHFFLSQAGCIHLGWVSPPLCLVP